MANRQTIQQLLKQVFLSYPKEAGKLSTNQMSDMVGVWVEYLGDLDDVLLAAAVREHITNSQWLPSIAEIRAAAVSIMRQASPARQSAIDAWGEVRREFLRVGSYGAPQFDNPITELVVRHMGWRELCLSESPDGVDRAQFERYYNGEIGRAERQAQQSPAVAAFIASLDASRFTVLPSPERELIATSEDLGY